MGKLDPSKSIEALLERTADIGPVDDAEEYLRFVADGDFQAALAAVEKRLTDAPSEVRARLYWVECQLRLGQVPVTALTTPLEELHSKVLEEADLLFQSTLTYLRAGVVLSDKGQFRLSVTVLQWANELAETCEELDKDERAQIRELYVSALEEEIEKAAVRRESKVYIEGLKTELASLRKKYKSNGNGKAKRKRPVKRRVFNSKSIIKDVESAENEAAEEDEEAADDDAPSRKPGNSFFGFAVWLTSLAMVTVGALYLLNHFYPRMHDKEIDARLAMEAPIAPAAELLLPSMRKRIADAPKSAGAKSNFKGVAERLNKLQQPGEAPEEPGAKSDNAETKSADRKKPKPRGRRQALADEIKADMERERARLEAARNKEVKDNTPSLDPKHLDSTTVQDLDSGKNKTPIKQDRSQARRQDVKGLNVARESVRDLQIAGNGRVYGRPKSGEGQQPVGVSPVDGSPVKAVEVQEFKEVTYFRTITATEVFSRPSLLAKSLAHLEPDAKVQVVARMGEWLELLSTGGRRGYIYAQDAVMINSSR